MKLKIENESDFVKWFRRKIAANNFNPDISDEFIVDNYYDAFKEKIKTVSASRIKLYMLGIEPQSTKIKYYTDRGWSEKDSKEKLRSRQSTMSIVSVMKTHKCDEAKAKSILNERIERGVNTLKSKPLEVLNEINKAKGKSLRREHWLSKINPHTGKLYTENEATAALSRRQAKGFNNMWAAVKNGRRIYISNTMLEYYLQKTNDISEAKKLLSERQATFTLEKCVAKYGEEEGYRIWKARQETWLETLSKKSDEEKLDILIRKTTRSKRYSKEANRFILKLLDSLGIDPDCPTVYFADREKFLWFKSEDKQRIFFYDLVISHLNLVVEYNGSKFHPNPKILNTAELWNKWVNPITKLSAQRQHENDKLKLSLANSKYKHVFEVWDTDDHDRVISQIRATIKENQNV
jgi:hypothetical protein